MSRKIKINLPDGSEIEVEAPISALEAAGRIHSSLAEKALAAEVDGELLDIRSMLENDCRLRIIMPGDPEALTVLRHSTSHLMALAVLELFPDAVFAIGPAIKDGFYYDFDIGRPFDADDTAKIENRMRKLAKKRLKFERLELPPEEALEIMRGRSQRLKIELIEEIAAERPDDVIALYRLGDFLDLCRGPHLSDTGRIKAFKLLTTSAAYWRGDSKRDVLQRIYGTAFFDSDGLEARLAYLEEVKRRDHRAIGKDLDLFSFHEDSPGCVFWHEKGFLLYDLMLDFWKEIHRSRGYRIVSTPMIMCDDLWKKSGHYDNYRENMYFTKMDDRDFAVRPMNCPGSLLVYRSSLKSYRDLPLRMGELGQVYRAEKSGVLGGLFRVRSFIVDDGHIFCTEEQLEDEVIDVMRLIVDTYKAFGMTEYEIELSTKPEKAIGSDDVWEKATRALENALKREGAEYRVSPGEGAFYGPKIDFHIKDVLGRFWQCGTVQVDFSMPERFDLTYIGEDGEQHRPVMVHRADYGSPERFMAVLIEHYAGAFPLWFSPEQVRVLSIADRNAVYAEEVAEKIKAGGLRAAADTRSQTIGYKIREATKQKVPFMVILGDKEEQSGRISVRHRTDGDLGEDEVDRFVQELVSTSVRQRAGGEELN